MFVEKYPDKISWSRHCQGLRFFFFAELQSQRFDAQLG